MLFRVVACIIQIFVRSDVFVDVIRFDLKRKAPRVCVQQLAPWAVLFFFSSLYKTSYIRILLFSRTSPAKYVRNPKPPEIQFLNLKSDQLGLSLVAFEEASNTIRNLVGRAFLRTTPW